MTVTDHYGKEYFADQLRDADLLTRMEMMKFVEFVGPGDAVLDFGCGSGLLLSRLACKDRLGVEVNPNARAYCAESGLKAVAALEEVPDHWADLAITNHALEHVRDPVGELTKLKAKLKPTGKLVVYVPCERADSVYDPVDRDRHLFTWSPLNAGNLMWAAGYRVLECRIYHHRVPPGARWLRRLVGWRGLELVVRAYGWWYGKIRQVRIVAEPA